MPKLLICTIALLVIIGCAATGPKIDLPDPNALDKSMDGITFYTQMLIELSDAIDILRDESLAVEDRMWIYKRKMELIQMKTDLFEATRDK